MTAIFQEQYPILPPGSRQTEEALWTSLGKQPLVFHCGCQYAISLLRLSCRQMDSFKACATKKSLHPKDLYCRPNLTYFGSPMINCACYSYFWGKRKKFWNILNERPIIQGANKYRESPQPLVARVIIDKRVFSAHSKNLKPSPKGL